MNYFYMDDQSREIGPVSQDSLKSFRVAGVIKDHTLVRSENGGPWVTCVSVVGTVETSNAPQSPAMAKVSEAMQHAKSVWLNLLTNPVGGMFPAYQQLGAKRAGGAGAVFIAAYAIIALVLVYMTKTFGVIRPADFGGFLKLLFTLLACCLTWAAAMVLIRLLNRREGDIGGEVFVAGTISLVGAVDLLLISILGFGNMEVLAIVFLVSICIVVLQVFVGLTRISGLDERIGTFMVPLVIVGACWLSKIIFMAVYADQMANGMSDELKGHSAQWINAMNVYFYRDNSGKEIGPLDLDALGKLRATGMLNDNTLVRSENSAEWKSLRELLPPLTAPQTSLKSSTKSINWSWMCLLIAAVITIVAYYSDSIKHEAEAEQSFRKGFMSESQRTGVKLISFKATSGTTFYKTNSFLNKETVVESYKINFEAEYEFERDVAENGIDAHQGDRARYAGTLIGEKTERGWDVWPFAAI